MAKNETMKLVANNKKAYHDYFIEENKNDGIVEKKVCSSARGIIL